MLKKPISFEEQLKKFTDHGIEIDDYQKTLTAIKEIGYYRLSGYAIPFRLSPECNDYKEKTKFTDILVSYYFDSDLRDVLRKFIEIAEIYYRVQISNGFSYIKCQKPPHNQHYKEENFYNKQSHREIMESISREKNFRHKDSLVVRHHDQNYSGEMPLWVIVELLSFSNLSKMYKSMYTSDKEYIAKQLGTGHATLSNHLYCLSVLRNKCAHGARLCDTKFTPIPRFPKKVLHSYPEMTNGTLFPYILILMFRLPNKHTKRHLCVAIIDIVERYRRLVDISRFGFPENYQDILNKYSGLIGKSST